MNLDELKNQLQKLKDTLEWYNLFVDYIYEIDSNKYNQGCDYADKHCNPSALHPLNPKYDVHDNRINLIIDKQELDYITMLIEQNLEDNPQEYGELHKQMLEDLNNKLKILNK